MQDTFRTARSVCITADVCISGMSARRGPSVYTGAHRARFTGSMSSWYILVHPIATTKAMKNTEDILAYENVGLGMITIQ